MQRVIITVGLCYRAFGSYLLESIVQYADTPVLRSIELLLKKAAPGEVQILEYALQSEFGLVAASLFQGLPPNLAEQYRLLREISLREVSLPPASRGSLLEWPAQEVVGGRKAKGKAGVEGEAGLLEMPWSAPHLDVVVIAYGSTLRLDCGLAVRGKQAEFDERVARAREYAAVHGCTVGLVSIGFTHGDFPSKCNCHHQIVGYVRAFTQFPSMYSHFKGIV